MPESINTNAGRFAADFQSALTQTRRGVMELTQLQDPSMLFQDDANRQAAFGISNTAPLQAGLDSWRTFAFATDDQVNAMDEATLKALMLAMRNVIREYR
jgi:hypothetical protein